MALSPCSHDRADPRARAARGLLAPLALCALGACASYTEKTAQAMHAFEAGRFDEASAQFSDPDTTDSRFLAAAETGMVHMAAGDWAAAVESLSEAALAVQAIEERALVSAAGLGEDLLSFVTNEGAQAYQGEGFERVVLHAVLALGYLAQGNVDGVWVEARRANKLLESEEELYEKEYAAGGLGHFVSAVTYELIGRLDEAYIDYERMVAKGVGVEIAGPALVRIAGRLGYADELERWRAEFGEVSPPAADAATIVVFAGMGLAPEKREISITLPAPEGLLRWSVPSFFSVAPASAPLTLFSERADGARDAVVTTALLEDLETVAKQNLADRIAWLGTKSAVRAGLKYALTSELGDQHGTAGLIVGSIFAVASERADLRSWRTLPGSWQAARAFVPPGEHALALGASDAAPVGLGRYALEPGETQFILARVLGSRVYAHVIGGRRLDAPPEPAEPAAAGIENTTP